MNQKEIKAKKLNRHTYYISRNTFEDNKLNWRKTYYRLEVLSEENGFKKYLLYDTSGNPVDDFYKYMNIVISSKGDAQRKRIAYSLKRLYECADIYEVDVKELDEGFMHILRAFLKGGIIDDRKTTTNDGDTEIAFEHCRIYLEYYGYKIKKNNFLVVSGLDTKNKSNTMDLTLKPSDMFVPEYISDKEFAKLMDVMKKRPRKLYSEKFVNGYGDTKDYKIDDDLAELLGIERSRNTPPIEDIEAILIVTLMFTCGFRIGEVLGLTTEDIKCFDNKKLIVLRNRLSDEEGQHSKNIPHPRTVDDYKKSWYRNGKGRCEVEISDNIYDIIMSYRKKLLEPYIRIYDSPTLLADSVEESGIENHYIFMNTNGGRLNSMAWNRILRDYFDKAGIKRDREIKKSNLNHRFRHSYAIRIVAMFRESNKMHPDNPPFGVADLARALRHRTISTCMRYFSWTMEHASEVLEAFSNDFKAEFPEALEVFGLNNK